MSTLIFERVGILKIKSRYFKPIKIFFLIIFVCFGLILAYFVVRFKKIMLNDSLVSIPSMQNVGVDRFWLLK